MNDVEYLQIIYEKMQVNEHINKGDLIDFKFKLEFNNENVYGLVVENEKDYIKNATKTRKQKLNIIIRFQYVTIIETKNGIITQSIKEYLNPVDKQINPDDLTLIRIVNINGSKQQLFTI